MSDSTGGNGGREALGALVELARNSVSERPASALEPGLQHVWAELGRHQAQRSQLRRWSMVAAVAVLLPVAVFASFRLGLRSSEPATLAYTVEGGRVVDGGYLQETGHGGITLAFNEGTTFTLRAGAHARLRSVDSSGARLAIEQGRAAFRITPSSRRHWSIDVGPFLVTVKGTEFSVSWDAPRERFELRLNRGVVTVSGPLAGGDITLRAGQRLVADMTTGETRISQGETGANAELPAEVAEPPLAPVSPSEMPRPSVRREHVSAAPKPASAGPRASSSASSAEQSEPDHHWTAALAAGRWDQILRQAEHEGIDNTLGVACADDIFALADAARYRLRAEVARQALLTLRRRFPNSPRASDAMYLLGRIDESGDARRALRWYDDYLSQLPDGVYASEALGRKMILTNKLEGRAQSQPLAADYLRRFPNGSYAGAARALWHAP